MSAMARILPGLSSLFLLQATKAECGGLGTSKVKSVLFTFIACY